MEASAKADRNADTFVFEGVEVKASLRSDSKWHVRTKGVEAVNTHLGTAVRILFDPQYHADASALIHEILAADAARPGR
jgi:hypothetical protein